MPHLSLKNVDIEFPLFHSHARSLKHALFGAGFARNLLIRPSGEVRIAALRDVSLELSGGHRIALMGANGAGKTTLLKVMAGIYEPAHGKISAEGDVRALLVPTLGLDLEANGWRNIFLMGAHMGLRPAIMRNYADEIASWTELGAYMDAPLKVYSAGMLTRLSFATATSHPADILLLDEWLGAGDAAFQVKAYERMRRFVERASILVLASHSLDILELWCDQAILLDRGRLIEFGEFASVRHRYQARLKSPNDLVG